MVREGKRQFASFFFFVPSDIMRSITILYILVVYVIFQFCWWAYLLTDLNTEVYRHKIELAQLRAGTAAEQELSMAALSEKMSQRKRMVIGEGIVFLSLLIWGSIVTYRAFRRDVELARLQKNFLLSVTHEFKSPLASIKLYLETMGRHELEKDKQQVFIRKAIRDTERLNNLVENALMASMIDHRKDFLSSEEIELSTLITTLTRQFGEVPGHPKVELDITENLQLRGDRNAIGILFNNLLENAAKYSPKESSIFVSLTTTSDHIILRVADHGIGIPDIEKEKVFQKFYRSGNEETRNTKGTGLGLYLANYIVKQHNGTIRIYDNQPSGAIFEVTFAI